MKKSILIILCIIISGYCAASDYEKYQINKKDIGAAVSMQLVWPGMGNYYITGNITKAIVYPLVDVTMITTGIILLNTGFSSDAREITGYSLAFAGPLLVTFVSLWDVVVTNKYYEKKLQQQLNLTMNVTDNGLKVNWNF